MKFSDLGLAEPIVRAVATTGYDTPTPIQAQAIPQVLAGRDLFGCAQTGTGKTAAFALPILHRLHTARPATGSGRKIRVLVLSPTRELASQISEFFSSYGRNTPLRNAVIFGGVNQNPQVKALRNGIDILVATPGRLLDLLNQGHVDLRAVEIFVLDEADRMLDLGFFPDIRKVVARLSTQRQTLLFSATMPADIRELAQSILRDPLNVHVAPMATAADRIEQGVFHVSKRNKPTLLRHLLRQSSTSRALVFTRTKRGADRVVNDLIKAGIRAAAIHGDKSQAQREKALDGFKAHRVPVLVATDIAARGIDVDAVSHVFNYDVPNVAETYVHRIGRTARAGASGIAVSFCDAEERGDLRAIERLLRQPITVRTDHPEYPHRVEVPATETALAEGSSAAGQGRPPSGAARPPRNRRRPGSGRGRPAAVGQSATSARPFRSTEPHANKGGSGSRARRRRPRRGDGKAATA
ncbi:MAG: DEAD/DEAH box helicase [Planctomycetaceae bacterium]|nr:DEAD/DEAH box helicase [Planctomycetaceae bacterium]